MAYKSNVYYVHLWWKRMKSTGTYIQRVFKQVNHYHIITIFYHKFQMSVPLGKNPSRNKSLKIEYVCNSKPY